MNIKNKIDKIGVPLKDWDIQINYGIKTGCNEAFIINNEKREEILLNCLTEEERKITAEIIRPILRGRDIQRFDFHWAGLYLIATFPSRHYDINHLPALKAHLLSFGIEKLEQTGCEHLVKGKKIKARKKTNNKWFETQDSISYWDHFSKPKIMWKRVGSILRFSYDKEGHFGLDSTCFAIGEHLEFLVCLLNSPMGHYLLRNAPKTGTGDLLISVQAVEPILAPKPEDTSIYERYLANGLFNEETEREINKAIYELYDLTDEEISLIEQSQLTP